MKITDEIIKKKHEEFNRRVMKSVHKARVPTVDRLRRVLDDRNT